MRRGAEVVGRSNVTVALEILVRTLSQPPAGVAWAWALERNAAEPLEHRMLYTIADAPNRPPTAGELWLWFVEPAPVRFAEYLPHLDHAEQARALRFRFASDRRTWAASRASLRALLARMLDTAPLSLRFLSGSNGKLFLPSTPFHFNVSHTRGLVAIAISGSQVGIDLEPIQILTDLMDIARLTFAPEMQAALHACRDETMRARMFFRFWTLGEAYIKATGEGISQGLSSFVFDHDAAKLTRASPRWGPVSRWRFHTSP